MSCDAETEAVRMFCFIWHIMPAHNVNARHAPNLQNLFCMKRCKSACMWLGGVILTACTCVFWQVVEKPPFFMKPTDRRKVIHVNFFAASVRCCIFPGHQCPQVLAASALDPNSVALPHVLTYAQNTKNCINCAGPWVLDEDPLMH